MSRRSGSKPDGRENAWLDAQNRRAARQPSRRRRQPTTSATSRPPLRSPRSPLQLAARVRPYMPRGFSASQLAATLLANVALAALVVGLVAAQGALQLVVLGVAATAAGGAAYAHSRHLRNVRAASPEDIARHNARMRASTPRHTGGGPVHVSASGRATSHTRARPGHGRQRTTRARARP